MLMPERMCMVDCIVSKDYRDRLVSELHSEGVAEITFLEDSFLSENAVSRDIPPERITSVSDLISKAKKTLDFLNSYGDKKGGFVDDILDIEKVERIRVKQLSYSELLTYAHGILDSLEDSAQRLQSRLHGIESRSSEVKSIVEKYSPYKGFGLSARHFEDSEYLHAAVGLMPTEGLTSIEKDLSQKLGNSFLLLKAGALEENTVVILVALKEKSEALEEELRKSRFNRLNVDIYGKFDDALNDAELELEKLSVERRQAEEDARELSNEYRMRLLAAIELLEIEKERCAVFSSCGSTEKATYIRFYTPEKHYGKVEELIKRQTKNVCAIKKTNDLDEAPVLLNNPSWIRPFEALTKMFATPNYNQIDPTMLLAPTFVLFFGLMFCDFAYGMVLILAAYLLYRKYKPYSESIKDLSVILTYFGVSSMFFGMLTGSYLGDFIGKYLFGSEKGSQAIALWLDPLYNGNILTYIGVVLSIGFLHLMFGYAAGAYDALRKRQYRTALLDYFTLMLLPIGAICYAAFGWQAGLLVSGASLILLFIGSGVMGLYIKVSGLLGSVVSYARLLALMASSSGIAMTVNFMAYLALTIPYAGVILAPLIFLGGHAVNLALNILGSFVHTLRLHYVEYFGTFYEGGGLEFTPFSENRKYSAVIKEEAL